MSPSKASAAVHLMAVNCGCPTDRPQPALVSDRTRGQCPLFTGIRGPASISAARARQRWPRCLPQPANFGASALDPGNRFGNPFGMAMRGVDHDKVHRPHQSAPSTAHSRHRRRCWQRPRANGPIRSLQAVGVQNCAVNVANRQQASQTACGGISHPLKQLFNAPGLHQAARFLAVSGFRADMARLSALTIAWTGSNRHCITHVAVCDDTPNAALFVHGPENRTL